MTVKRLFDVVVSTAGFAITAIPMLLVAAAIKLTSAGGVLYQSERIGLNGEPFTLLKFRTMVADADQAGPSSTAAGDPRITTVGNFLRKWKLDEMPQLLNVLRGDMSIVGPRPQVRWAVERYSETQKRLLTVQPGITDRASILFRNEAEILEGHDDPDAAYLELIEPKKVQLGLEYVDNQSMGGDIRIILDTVAAVLGKYEPEGDDS